jgi:hypothetical protein
MVGIGSELAVIGVVMPVVAVVVVGVVFAVCIPELWPLDELLSLPSCPKGVKRMPLRRDDLFDFGSTVMSSTKATGEVVIGGGHGLFGFVDTAASSVDLPEEGPVGGSRGLLGLVSPATSSTNSVEVMIGDGHGLFALVVTAVSLTDLVETAVVIGGGHGLLEVPFPAVISTAVVETAGTRGLLVLLSPTDSSKIFVETPGTPGLFAFGSAADSSTGEVEFNHGGLAFPSPERSSANFVEGEIGGSHDLPAHVSSTVSSMKFVEEVVIGGSHDLSADALPVASGTDLAVDSFIVIADAAVPGLLALRPTASDGAE